MDTGLVQRRRALLLFILLSFWFSPAVAAAHGGNTGPIRTVTQAVGPYVLSVMLELPSVAPAVVFIDITPQQPIPGVTLQLRAAPRGQPFAGRPVADISGLDGPPTTYLSQLDVERAGEWELELRASGPQGAGVAYIPFPLAVAPVPGLTWALVAALGALVALLAASIGADAAYKARGGAPQWLARSLSYATVASLTAAVVFGTLEALSAGQAAAPVSVPPHVNVALRTSPAAPLAGQPLRLTLDVTDGGSGLVADDLVPHNEALLSLIVLDEANSLMHYVQPTREEPGRFAVDLTLERPGRYTAYAELKRQGGGVQLIGREFVLGGAAVAEPAAPPGFGTQQIGGVSVAVSAVAAPLRAGQAVTLSLALSAADGPLRDLEPWLGGVGQLVGRSADGQTVVHAPAAEPPPPAGPAGLAVRYGPVVRFVYAFPQPGEYRLWAQFKRGGALLTVPLRLAVAP